MPNMCPKHVIMSRFIKLITKIADNEKLYGNLILFINIYKITNVSLILFSKRDSKAGFAFEKYRNLGILYLSQFRAERR